MTRTLKPWTLKSVILPLAAASAMSLSSSLFAFADVLEKPVMKSTMAVESLLLDVERLDSGRLITAGERGHILYSDDQGKSWKQAEVPVIVNIIATNFPTSKVGWAVGHDGVVLKSTDAGESWVKQFDGFRANQKTLDQYTVAVKTMETQLENASELADGSVDVEELEYQLEELQFKLEDAQYDLEAGSTKPYLDVWFKNEQTGFVVGAYGQLIKTTDGGENWISISNEIDNPDGFHLNAITETQPGTLFIVGEAGIILRSTDSGQSWTRVESPYEGSLFGASPTRQLNGVLVYGLRGNVYRSSTLGDQWEAIKVNTKQTLNSGSAFKDGTIMLVGNNGIILKSYDSGRNFTSKVREDRASLVSITESQDGGIVLVGNNGLLLALPNAE